MNLQELENLKGKVIRFTKAAETDFEIDFDEGMMARVTAVVEVGNGVVRVYCNFVEFEERNIRHAKPNYYDGDGVARLRWHETSLYPNNKETDVYLGIGEAVPFEIVDPLSIGIVEIKADQLRRLLSQIRMLVEKPDNPAAIAQGRIALKTLEEYLPEKIEEALSE